MARASGWRLQQLDTQAWSRRGAPAASAGRGPQPQPQAKDWDRNYVHSLDWRWLTEPLNEGPGESWINPTVDLVNGETMTPLERLFAVADCANGIGSKLDITRWTFLNNDLAVHVHRVPDGDWIGIRAETSYGPDGIGTTVGTLFDEKAQWQHPAVGARTAPSSPAKVQLATRFSSYTVASCTLAVGRDDVHHWQMRADRRRDQTRDVGRRHRAGRPDDRGPHAGADEFGVQAGRPGLEHAIGRRERRADQSRADQHHVATSVVDHRRNDLCRKVLRTHPRTVSHPRCTDQHVDGTDQVVGGPDKPIDRRRIREVQVSRESRRAITPKLGGDPLTDIGAAGPHQHQITAGGQSRRSRECNGRCRFGDDYCSSGLAHEGHRSAAMGRSAAKIWWSTTGDTKTA